MTTTRSNELPFLKALFTPSGIECTDCASIARGQIYRIWAVCLIFLCLSGILNVVPPNVHFVLISDTRYHYPLLKETFPSYICFIVAFGIPSMVFILPHLLAYFPKLRMALQAHTSESVASSTSDHSHDERTRPLQASRPLITCSSHTAFDLPQDSRWFRGLLSNSTTFFGLIMTISVSVFITTLLKTIAGRPRPNAVALSLHRHLKAKTPQFIPDPLFEPTGTESSAPLVHVAQALASLTSASPLSTAFKIPPASPYLHHAGSTLGDILDPTSLNPPSSTAEAIQRFMSNNVQYNTQSSYTHLLASEALRSFPSGHSSFTFACMVYLILVLIDKYHDLYDRKDIVTSSSINAGQIASYPVHAQASSTSTSTTTTSPSSSTTSPYCSQFKVFMVRVIRPLFYSPEAHGRRNFTSHCGSPACLQSRTKYHGITNEIGIGNQAASVHSNFIQDKENDNEKERERGDMTESEADDETHGMIQQKSQLNGLRSCSDQYQDLTTMQGFHETGGVSSTYGSSPHYSHPSRAFAYTFYMLVPLLAASTIAISRIWDFWHHPDDVLAGTLLGIGCAFAVRKMLR